MLKTTRIKKLNNNLINQIAAGEVIERPYSIVKELVENSIDAGSTQISVEIENECRNIRIADNGSGIDKDDIELAFSRHATSKISTQDDLWKLTTLGFRGEALASIISVSKVSCTTRTANSSVGYKAECADSGVKILETGCAQGTIMEVKDLFYNTPVRLKFLKKGQTEFAYIQEIMQSIAISHPEIAFTLLHKGHKSMKTSGSSDIETVISEVYSADLINELSVVDEEDELAKMSLCGVISSPEFTRSNRKAIYLFANGRIVKCPIMQKAINSAYADMIPNGRYPFVVLSLNLKPDEIDVNVHPSKKEIRYTNPNMIYGFVYHSIKNTLQNTTEQIEKKPQESFFESKDVTDSQFKYEPKEVFVVKDHNNENTNQFFTKKTVFEESEPVYTEQKSLQIQNIQSKEEKFFNIVGQYKNTYILFENEEGLEVVDQHIAHERYIYEQLKEKHSQQEQIPAQLLFTSNIIELEALEISLIRENEEKLDEFGYKFEILNEKEVILKKIPQVIANKQPEQIISELLEALDGDISNLDDSILIMTSCKAAIKAGEKLSNWQMQELLQQWSSTKHPKTCPHGRPISHTISEKTVAGFFGRNV